MSWFRPCWPKPNVRVTKGKLSGLHFAEYAKDEEREASLREDEALTSSNRR
jgi:hypothetical protein